MKLLVSQERAARDASRFERCGDRVLALRRDGLLLHASPAWTGIIDLPASFPRGGCLLDEIAPRSAAVEGLVDFLQESLAGSLGESGVEAVHLCELDGEAGTVTLEGRVYLGDSGDPGDPAQTDTDHALAIFRDVSAQWQKLKEIETNERRFRIVAAASRDMFSETEQNGLFSYVSSACLDVLGYRPEELVGTSPLLLHDPDEIDGFVAQLREGSKADLPFEVAPHRLRHRDGSWVWVESVGIRYRSPTGEWKILGVAHDISSQVDARAARAELEERVLRSQKLESLGVLAGGIAHDFNNFLTPIVGNAGLLLDDLAAGSPLRKRVEMIRLAANRATALTRQMLTYAGQATPGAPALDVSQVIRDISLLIDASVARGARVQYELEDDLPPIKVDSAHIGQVVMNLVANASDALPTTGGEIQLRTGSVDTDGAMLDACFIGSEMEKGLCVYIEVCDNGSGIDRESLPRIFDPFFTTRFEGRGLGLASVHGVVRGHHGAIELTSEPGQGTRIRVLFPAACEGIDTSAASPGGARRAEATSVSSERSVVLVVDDDEGSCDLMSTALTRGGFHVIQASDGESALRIFERRAAMIRAVVLDCTLPGISGRALFDALREIRPEVRIALVSGYSRERVADALLERGADSFLQKPFDPEDFVEEIRRLCELEALDEVRSRDTTERH